MRDLSGNRRAHVPWLLLLGACTLWLVVQNTLLAMALLWTEPGKALTVAGVLFKTAAGLVAGFWTSPALPLILGAALVGALAAPALVERTAREGIRHG